jgi:hypothetical protein
MSPALSVLPRELRALVLAHARRYPADAADLPGEAAVAWLEALAAGEAVTAAAVFARARARVRRFAMEPTSRWVVPLEAAADAAAADDRDADHDDRPGPASWRRRDVVRWLAEVLGVSLRRAQRQVAEVLRRAQEPQVQMSLWGV